MIAPSLGHRKSTRSPASARGAAYFAAMQRFTCRAHPLPSRAIECGGPGATTLAGKMRYILGPPAKGRWSERMAVTSGTAAGTASTSQSGRTMRNLHVIAGIGESPSYPAIRKIALADIRDALVKGIDDFSAMPSDALFLGVLYPLIGLFPVFLTLGYEVVSLLFPLA